MTERPRDSADAEDSAVLARQWIEHLRDQSGAASDDAVLWYFRQQWHEWTGSRWRVRDPEYLSLRLARFLGEREGAAGLSRRLLAQVMLNLQAETLLESWETPPPFEVRRRRPLQLRPGRFLRFDNGVLKLRTDGRLAPFSEHAGSRFFSTASVPCAYEPEADCPRWRRFLETVLPPEPCGDDGVDRRQAVLQEAVLASLLGEPYHRPLVLLTGTARGGNGKSTLMKVWQALLDDQSISRLSFDALRQPADLAALRGRQVNFADELPDPSRLERRRLLQALRGEPIELPRRPGLPPRVEPAAMWVGVGSQLPDLTAEDRRWWRLALVVPFDLSVRDADADPNLARRIVREELPGVVNWALEAASRLAKDRLTRCPRCVREAAAHVRLSDPLEQFLEECCHLPPPPNHSVRDPRDAIYQAYLQYCRTRLGAAVRPLSRAHFGQRLRQYGVGDARHETLPDGRRPRFYTGIALAPDGLALLRELGYHAADTAAEAGGSDPAASP